MIQHLLTAKYLLVHKLAIIWSGRKLGVNWSRLIWHDWSKLSKEEWSAYANFHHVHDQATRNKRLEIFKKAWRHHVLHNRHHPQFFTRPENANETVNQQDVLEMVADWWAAGYAQGKNDLREYWESKQEKVLSMIGEQWKPTIEWAVKKLEKRR